MEVLAPNGFYRRFVGNAQIAPPHVSLKLQMRSGNPTGALELHLHNTTSAAQTYTITDNSYGALPMQKTVAAGAAQVIAVSLEKSHYWYDVTVQSAHSKAYAQFAGRVETGAHTQTDPLMANV